MKRGKRIGFILLAALAGFAVLAPGEGRACTGIQLKTEDGDHIYARTLEFSVEEASFDLIFVPRNREYRGHTPSSEPGMSWKVKYAHVGFSPFGLPVLGDGLNEKGLACGLFFFPGYAGYETVAKADYPKTLSCLDLASWILGACSTVAEVRERLPKIRLCGAELKEWGTVPPLHWVVADETGDSIIIEYVGGKRHIYDNKLGVITNSPPYDWHLTNLRNYIGLSAVNDPTVTVDGVKLAQLGQGSGAIGLPGDFTPPSRFVRAAFLSRAAYPGKDADEGVASAFHILNQFDIPSGSIREVQGDKVISEATQWTSAADMKSRKYYFHTHGNRTVRMIDLSELDLDAGEIKTIDVQGPGGIEDITEKLQTDLRKKE